MNFSALTVKQKLFLTYSLMMGLALVLGATAMVKISDLTTSIHALGVEDARKMFDSGTIRAYAATMMATNREAWIDAYQHDTAGLERSITQREEAEAKIREATADIRSVGATEAAEAGLARMEADLDHADPIVAHYTALLRQPALMPALELRNTQLLRLMQDVDDTAESLRRQQRSNMNQASEAAQLGLKSAFGTVGVVLSLGLLVGMLAMWIVLELDRELRQNVLELGEGSEQVASAAREVAAASQALARDSAEQAAMIEETSASAEEINATAKRNTENAQGATQLVAEAMQANVRANQAMEECVTSMDAIGQSSEQIAKIIDVIEKIAFQTNILALNAAVEAARSGEAGMGFAVVAEEVRNLAQRCAQAAQETAVLIQRSVGNTTAGRAKIGRLVESGQKVNEGFARIKVLVDEVGESSQEQCLGVEQIGQAIVKMEQVTLKGAANAEEGAAAAEQLTAQSDALRQVAAQLGQMVGIHGHGTMEKPVRRAPTRVELPRFSPPSARVPVKTRVMAGTGSSQMALDDKDFREF